MATIKLGELLIKANTPDMSEDPAESRLIFYAPVAAVAEGTTIDLAKQDFEDATDVVFFVLDRQTDNEVNSDTEDSTGRITVSLDLIDELGLTVHNLDGTVAS